MTMRLAVIMSAAVAVFSGACGGSSDSADDAGRDGSEPVTAGTNTVILKDLAFKPGTIAVAVGETVTWKFDDGAVPHNVVAEDESFQSETTNEGSFTHTFGEAGEFPYVCTIHPNMKGTVEVR